MTRRSYLALCVTFPLAGQTPSFVPANFFVPQNYVVPSGQYQLVPLGPAYAKHDFDAYMSSIEHLQKTFTFSTRWPHAGLTMEEAVKDVEGEIAGFNARRKFTYAVLNPAGTEEWGCVYISPSPKQGYDAQVRMWVTKKKFDAGFEDTLFADAKAWISSAWPFGKVAYIGREITREAYRALPDKPKAAK
ncbi:MAG: hypothetical protein NW208_18525 [Bryobacter sp.]|nr:hypothetical protein [Bryobacter sp.]